MIDSFTLSTKDLQLLRDSLSCYKANLTGTASESEVNSVRCIQKLFDLLLKESDKKEIYCYVRETEASWGKAGNTDAF